VWLCKYSNFALIWLLLWVIDVLAALIGEETATRSPPYTENERERSVNNF